jgi:CRP/FNR family transcriptional regulator, cyclic AMP receptor protein
MPLKMVPGRDRKLNRLVKRGQSRKLRRGEILYSAGDPGTELYVVMSGLLHLTVQHGDRKGRTVDVVGPWELAGEEALAAGATRRTGARAGGTTQVTVIGGEEASLALRTASRTFQFFLQAKDEALALARIPGAPPSAGGTPGRVASVLLHLSARFGRKEGNAVRITIRVTHQVLADLSGSHRSTVTTLLNEWIYDGILGNRGRELWVLRPEALVARGRGAASAARSQPSESVDPKSP